MEENNKKIMKNTIYLYIRMFVIMGLSFFTTRIVLEKLGASDYGINNLVAGFVSSFKVLNNILEGGTRRFLAYNLGKNNEGLIKRTFSTSLTIHLSIGIIIVIALESLGLWFLNYQLNIEPERIRAANIIFQLSVLTTFLSIIQTPYSAAVTAHEKFNIYAYMSIYDVVAKLAVLFLLIYIPGDKLIIYGILLAFVSTTSILIYYGYCLRQFTECKFSIKTDDTILKEMMKFSGWNPLGHIVVVFNGQGISILLNLFFNTVMNASKGLADTVSFTINQFIGGFLVAANPQLVKYYGAGDIERFTKLIFNVSQYTIFLMAIFCVPVLLEIDYVLKLWLTEVPQYTSEFIKIGAICSIIPYSNNMVDSGIVATGRVKEMNIYAIPVYFINLPLVYLVLKLGWYPPLVYFVGSIPAFIHFIINLKILSNITTFPSRQYFTQIFLKNFMLIVISLLIPLAIHSMMQEGLVRFLVVCTISVISTITIMYFFSLNKDVKQMVNKKIRSILSMKK